MGRSLHKLIRGVLPSWLLKRFFKSRASRTFSYIKIRQNSCKSAASPNLLPSSSSSLRHDPAAYHMDGEESTYYYSYSEDDQGNRTTAGHGDASSASIGSESRRRSEYGDMYLPFQCHDGQHNHLRHKAVDEDDDGSSHDDGSHPHMQVNGVQHNNYHSHRFREHDGKLDEGAPHQDLARHRGRKRKSLVLNEDDDNTNSKDKPACLMKRQKGGNVRYELPERISEIVGKGSVHVHYIYQEPQLAFWESMVDMIVSNELWDVGSQEALLLCYLTLNDPHLYSTICTSFLQALKDLHSFLLIS